MSGVGAGVLIIFSDSYSYFVVCKKKQKIVSFGHFYFILNLHLFLRIVKDCFCQGDGDIFIRIVKDCFRQEDDGI